MDVYAAGAAAAFTVDVLVYPLDTLKTRYQSQDYLKTYASRSSKPLAIRGVYQGIGSVVIATLPAAGVFFSTYEKTKQALSQTLPRVPQPLVHALASGVAELSSCLILAPAEVIKQNAQMQRSSLQGMSSSGTSGSGTSGSGKSGSGTSSSGKSSSGTSSTSLQEKSKSSSSLQGTSSSSLQGTSSSSLQAFRQLAPRQLFTGYTALAARNLPFTALQFPMYEQLRTRLWAWRRSRGGGDVGYKNSRSSSDGYSDGYSDSVNSNSENGGNTLVDTGLVAGVSAGTAGAIAAFVTTPSDVVKTRMMLMADKTHGSWAVARQVYSERGVAGFFRGGLFRSAWTALGSCLYLGTYDVAKLWLSRRKSRLETL